MPLYLPATNPFLSAAVPIVRPDLADGIVLPGLVALWAYGAWVQIVAANDLAHHALSHAFYTPLVLGNYDLQIQIGTGAAGAEVPLQTWGTNSGLTGDTSLKITAGTLFRFPVVRIPQNARVAGRVAWTGGSAVSVVRIALGFYPLPL